jgi:hypothetical protein
VQLCLEPGPQGGVALGGGVSAGLQGLGQRLELGSEGQGGPGVVNEHGFEPAKGGVDVCPDGLGRVPLGRDHAEQLLELGGEGTRIISEREFDGEKVRRNPAP